MGGLGLLILTFGFHVRPNVPPINVLLIIISVVTAASTLENAGGLKYLVKIAEKVIRKHPSQITFIAPIVTYIFTFLSGTTHISYSILPVIAEVARETNVRPERPLSASVTAAQQAITASPISAATATLISLLGPKGIELSHILIICVPSTLLGVIICSAVANKIGKELNEDSLCIAKMKAILEEEKSQKSNTLKKENEDPKYGKISIGIFIIGIMFIIMFGSFKNLRPKWEINGEIIELKMTSIIQIIMLSISAITIMVCNLNPPEIVRGNIFRSGMQAVIAIFGIAWLGITFFSENKDYIFNLIQDKIQSAPWLFTICLFVLSILLVSQATTTSALFPLGVDLGIPALTLLPMFPSVNGLFFLPNHPTIIAAINFDRTGSTKIGKYVLNHSFMIPGLVATISSVLIGFLLTFILY
jgi:anaerobic C4-dicarboxylate transporter DcuA